MGGLIKRKMRGHMLRGERLLPKGGEHQSVDTTTQFLITSINRFTDLCLIRTCYALCAILIYGQDITEMVGQFAPLFNNLNCSLKLHQETCREEGLISE